MILTLKPSSGFKKDLKRIAKRGYNLELLSETIEMIANGKKLPAKYKDHPLSGPYILSRECHIMPDWLLIYEVVKSDSILFLIRTGTHSDLF